jgi:uncharacterized protein
MTAIKEAASEFLSHRRVAVTGVSRNAKDHRSNVIYKRLRERATRSSRSAPMPTMSKAIVPTTTLRSIPGGVGLAAWRPPPRGAEASLIALRVVF